MSPGRTSQLWPPYTRPLSHRLRRGDGAADPLSLVRWGAPPPGPQTFIESYSSARKLGLTPRRLQDCHPERGSPPSAASAGAGGGPRAKPTVAGSLPPQLPECVMGAEGPQGLAAVMCVRVTVLSFLLLHLDQTRRSRVLTPMLLGTDSFHVLRGDHTLCFGFSSQPQPRASAAYGMAGVQSSVGACGEVYPKTCLQLTSQGKFPLGKS